MSSGPLLVRAAVAAVCFALAAAPAGADQNKPKPSAGELLREYPLEPTATATAARTPTRAAATATPARAAAPAAANDGGGVPLLPIALAVLAAGGVAGGVFLARRRRRADLAPAPPAAAAAGSSPPATPASRPAAAQRLRDAAGPAPDRTAERLRDAAAMRRARQWPWPAGSEDLWRCEIAPDTASLSAHFRAVVHPPGGAPPIVIAESTAGPAGAADWQSAAPLEQAVDALARQLETRGWQPVEGGADPQVRRFCRSTPPRIHTEETAWTAHRS
jgi:hypothetical protein